MRPGDCLTRKSFLSSFPPVQYVYMDASVTPPCPDGGPSSDPCPVSITLDKDIPGPVYFYYTLDGFHQVFLPRTGVGKHFLADCLSSHTDCA